MGRRFDPRAQEAACTSLLPMPIHRFGSILGGVVTGGDPADDRATRRQSVTVHQLCED
jgi:hypothetical protein